VGKDRRIEPRLGNTMAKLRRDSTLALLEAHGWGTTKAAKAGGMSERTLRARMKAYGLTRPAHVPAPKRGRPKRKRATEFRKVADWTWEAIAP